MRRSSLKISSDSLRGAAEGAGDLERLALVAPPALDGDDRAVEISARHHRRPCAKSGAHHGMIGSEPDQPLDSHLERVDGGGFVESRADLRERSGHRRHALAV